MVEQEVIIREAILSDANNLMALLSQLGSETDFITSTELLSLEDMETFLTLRQSSINELCLLALVGSTPVGILNIASIGCLQMSHIGDVFIALKRDYWGYGLGQHLMDGAMDWVQHTPTIRRLELTVQSRNSRAINLYEKFDFKIEGVKKRGAKTKNGEFLDVYMMSKLID